MIAVFVHGWKILWRKRGGTGFLAADEFEPPPDDHFIAAP